MTGLSVLLANLIQIYQIMIIVRIIMTWMQVSPYNPIARFLSQFCDPLLDAARNAFPFLAQGGIDFSPIVVLFLLGATQRFLLSLA
ncbi:MAG: YggT family protein [Candidatus Hinthialibacter antarcticus]|nr:YggT family protein [Candidatus Hinthialibacter antarcticus]